MTCYDKQNKSKMEKEQKETLEKLGFRVRGSYIEQYIDMYKEPKQYWSNRPKTIDFQIYGWQIVAHVSKVDMFLSRISEEKKLK